MPPCPSTRSDLLSGCPEPSQRGHPSTPRGLTQTVARSRRAHPACSLSPGGRQALDLALKQWVLSQSSHEPRGKCWENHIYKSHFCVHFPTERNTSMCLGLGWAREAPKGCSVRRWDVVVCTPSPATADPFSTKLGRLLEQDCTDSCCCFSSVR